MAVRLPKSVLTQAGIGNSPTVFDISVNNDKEIILRKKKKPKNLKELLKDLIIKSIGLNGTKNIQENPKR